MIHILLLILKIIGIIFLVLFALILLVLFFPVTYKGNLEIHDGKAIGKVTAGWLFHVVHFGAVFEEKINYKVRVFGIPVFSSGSSKEDEQADENKDNKEEKKKQKEPQIEVIEIADKKKNSSEQTKNSSDNLKAGKGEEEQIKDNNKEDREAENVDSEFEEAKEPFTEKIKNFFVSIKNIISNIYTKIKEAKDKGKEIKRILKAKSTKRAIQYGKQILIKLLRHIRPRKIRANLKFGFEEPHMTGEVLGYIAQVYVLLHINPKHIELIPDFENKVLDGRVKLKGHFFLCVVGYYALRFYFKKEIHRLIKRFS